MPRRPALQAFIDIPTESVVQSWGEVHIAKMRRSALIAGAVAAFTSPPYVVRSQSLTNIRMVGAQTLDMTPAFYAIKSGMYEKAGLDVELVPASSGTFATTAVVAGTYQISKGSCISSLVAYLRGLPLKVIANGGVWDPKTPFTLTLVAADSPVKTAADLSGKTGGTGALNDMNQLSINAWVDKNGGDSKSLKWVEVPNISAAEAMLQKRIDFCALNEPQLTAAMETSRVRVLAPTYSAIAPRFVYATYSSNAEWADKNKDAVRRWVRTTYDRCRVYERSQRRNGATGRGVYEDSGRSDPQDRARLGRSLFRSEVDPAGYEVAAKYKYIPRNFSAKELYFVG
jgi:ABC-type nitrate/sulfonate/bicarbonate transport system substrate-binding protein